MNNIIKHRIVVFLRCEQGATLVEYGIAIALAITIGAATMNLLAGEIGNAMGAAGTAMPN